jgi:hypothetical protein
MQRGGGGAAVSALLASGRRAEAAVRLSAPGLPQPDEQLLSVFVLSG